MKRFNRTINLLAAAAILSGFALAQDASTFQPYAPPSIDYSQPSPNQMPTFEPPAPPPAISFPTGIQVGPAVISPTFNPPGIQATIPF